MGGGKAAPPPPPPPGHRGAAQGFKIVPGLGDALHEAMKKVKGVEEIEAAAEGVASDSNKQTSTPTGANRPKSWHGTQVPGKPKINRGMMSEMENRLAKRRDKVDKESYVSEGPDPVIITPPEPICLPPSGPRAGPGARKPSTASLDSGRGGSVDSLEPGGYTRVSVDRERKEELLMAKAVRRSSAKMLGRSCSPMSVSPGDSPVTVMEATPPPQANLPPPSPVVMRYWKQCSSTADSGYFGEEGLEAEEHARDENGEVIPTWKADAIEGEEQQFPSIADKIKLMEEEAKKPLAMYEVPDVKSKMNAPAPAAQWMEARNKLQFQLDTLITKTSEKMAKYGNVNVREREDFVKDPSSEADEGTIKRPPSPKEVVDKQVKTLIKTVANEIQKSFSCKSMNTLADEDEDEEEEEEEPKETEEEKQAREEKEKAIKAKRLIKEVKRRQKHIDIEAPILDFKLKSPTPEPKDEDEEEDYYRNEAPLDFDAPPGVVNHTAAKYKANLMRKISTAQKKAKIPEKVDAFSNTDTPFTDIEIMVADKLRRKEMFSDKVIQTQWDISNAEFELSKLSDDEKADMLSKQISKMKSKHVNKLLKSIDSGMLDISLPLLIPFLSLQARLSLGVDLFKNKFKAESKEGKNKMVKETFVDTMIKDITDIALLQEVIERSKEKLQILTDAAGEEERLFAAKIRKTMVNIEDDSWELGASPSKQRSVTPGKEKSATPARSLTPNVIKEPSPGTQPRREVAREESRERTKKIMAGKKSNKEQDEEIPYGVTEVVTDDEEEEEEECASTKEEVKITVDEGCPSSESEEDKEEIKDKIKGEESDEGLGKSADEGLSKSEDINSKPEEQAPKEDSIKQKILNIIQDAKKTDEKRNIRNFGRTFEFQGVKEALRPVLPNDRRPHKAKKLDCMWMQCTASKQKYNEAPAVPSLEELKARKASEKKPPPTLAELKARKTADKPVEDELKSGKPQASVPWTKRGNGQPVKREVLTEEKEVEDFESCQKTLKENVKNEASDSVKSVGQIQTVKRDAIVTTNANTVKETVPSSESDVSIKESKSVDEVSTKEAANTISKALEKSESRALEKTEFLSMLEQEIAVIEDEKTAVKAKESDLMVNELEAKNVSQDISLCGDESSSEVEWESSEDEEEIAPQKASVQKVSEKKAAPTLEELKKRALDRKATTQPAKKEKSPEKPPVPPKPVIKEIPSLLLMSPVVRRRGEEAPSSSHSLSVSASIRLPPPPSCRPPPPPVSPPVTVSKAKTLMKEDSSEEEESEWEYESESEEE